MKLKSEAQAYQEIRRYWKRVYNRNQREQAMFHDLKSQYSDCIGNFSIRKGLAVEAVRDAKAFLMDFKVEKANAS